MAAQDAKLIRHQLTLSRFIGHPVYFFDTSVLLDNVVSIADWNLPRLEAAIAPRVERVLDGAGIRIATDDGFYVVFVSHSAQSANDKANAVRNDLLRHFYGPGGYPPAVLVKLCRPSTLLALAGSLGIAEETLTRPRAKPSQPVMDELPEKGRALFAQELQTVFTNAAASKAAAFGKFVFSPLWDSKKARISAFSCATEMPWEQDAFVAARRSAVESCKHDIAALAAATRGIRHILSRDDLAAVSAPVHVETLSSSKTWNAYLEVLGHVDLQLRALLALRIVGLDPGANLLKIAQWTSGLHQHVRLIFVHLPNVNFDFGRVGALGVAGYGLTVVSPEQVDAKWLNLLSAQALKLSRICTNQNASAVMDNVGSEKELAAIKNQGVRFIAGPVIGAPEELPSAVSAFSLKEQSPQL